MTWRITSGAARLGPSVASAPTHRVTPAPLRFDTIDGGDKVISGTVYLKGPPQVVAARRVRLHERLTGRPVRETWSRPADGFYEFTKIRAGIYYVVAFDHTDTYNAVVKDKVTT